jgi:hypothetical protein
MYKTPEQYESASALIGRWAEKVAGDGGLIVSGNGIGRLKTALISRFLPPELTSAREAVKSHFDPGRLLD